MNKFFVDDSQIDETVVYINGDDVKHIRDVLRLNVGDDIEVSTFKNSYIVKIKKIANNTVVGNIIRTKKDNNEPPIDIVLFQGLPKSAKMEYIIQKATEIGIKEIYPLITKRTIVKINDIQKENKKIERWNKIVLEAAKQSKRDYVPSVKNIITFKEMIQQFQDEENVLVPYEDEKSVHLKDVVNSIKGNKINLVIGPEGGFEEEEINMLKNIGAKVITLGPRILRTETAGLVATSILLYELGDI